MSEPDDRAHRQDGEAWAGGELPAIIHLPDLSQPEPAPPPPRKPGRHTGRMKGRHFGPRPVADPLDAWIPATRCTKAQRKRAETEAAQAGVSLNGLVRIRMFETAGPRAHRAKPDRDRVLLAQMVAAQGRSG